VFVLELLARSAGRFPPCPMRRYNASHQCRRIKPEATIVHPGRIE
jgi:hypothetical protein